MLPWLLLACTGADPADPSASTDVRDSIEATDTDADTTDGDTDPVEATPPPRGLWVWDAAIPGDDAATEALLDFAAEHQVGRLFLSCDPVGYGQEGAEARYASFVDAAHAASVEVWAMSGYGWFTVPCDARLPGQPTCSDEGWSVFAACAASGVDFDGVMDDSEPHSVAQARFEADYAERAVGYLAYLRGVRARIGDLPFAHAIPAWFDDRPTVEDEGKTDTLDVHVAGIVDVVAVMSYRDTAEAVREFSSGELDKGPTWIGVETGPSDESENVTFFDDGADALDAALDALELSEETGFAGTFVHDYAGWRALVEAR
jgi:hypothetical protein